jgi:5,10-methylene-tetrahydrofolate dehydrogenase/methenyl tetrahydrofolate cyclohydrolase
MGQAEGLLRLQNLVVIGNGMVAGRALEEFLAKNHPPMRVTRVRRRTAHQLQPHPAVAGALGRKGL